MSNTVSKRVGVPPLAASTALVAASSSGREAPAAAVQRKGEMAGKQSTWQMAQFIKGG